MHSTYDDYVFAGTELGRVYRWKVENDTQRSNGNGMDIAISVVDHAQDNFDDVAQWHIKPYCNEISVQRHLTFVFQMWWQLIHLKLHEELQTFRMKAASTFFETRN